MVAEAVTTAVEEFCVSRWQAVAGRPPASKPASDNPVRVIDAFVEELDLGELGFDGVAPEATGRPSYHPSALPKLYIYGYLNRVQSSRSCDQE